MSVQPLRRRRAPRGSGEQLREEILDATTELLLETGHAKAVSIRSVAQRVGVTPPSIYLHFADKDALADSKDVRGYARRRFQRLVVPFAIPLMIGPGAISAVIIQAGEAAKLGYAGTMGSLVAITAACAVSFVCFALTGSLSRLLGEVGMAIIVKVLGLILCALAIQFILLGLGEAIPGMISGAVTKSPSVPSGSLAA